MQIAGALLLAVCAGMAAVGYGSGLAHLLRIRPNLGDRGLLGLLCLGFIGCLLHFAVALSRVEFVALAAGVLLAARFRRDIRDTESLGFLAIAGLCTFVLLHPQTVTTYDNGLYYMQAFKWNSEFPLTVGLGNLHGRLAFNSILFLIAPLVDRLEIGWITNLLAVTFVWLSLWPRLRPTDVRDRRSAIQFWFIVIVLVIFVFAPQFLNWLGIFVGDSIIAVLTVYWTAHALGLSDSADRRTVLALLVASASLATLVKISAAPLLIPTLALVWVHRKEAGNRPALILAVPAAVLGVWMLRGFLLSGCAIYPVPQTCLPELPWAVATQQVEDEKLAIRSWARHPGEQDFALVMRDSSWIPLWLAAARAEWLIRLLLLGCALGAAAVFTSGTKLRRQPRDDLGVIAIGFAACLSFWFWAAPNLRFATGFVLAAAVFGLSLACAAWLHQPWLYRNIPRALALLLVLSGLLGGLRLRRKDFSDTTPVAAVYQVPTPQGRGLWVPSPTDQCWAHDLPCTPYVNPTALTRIRWPSPWPYRYDPRTAPPDSWNPPAGIVKPQYKR